MQGIKEGIGVIEVLKSYIEDYLSTSEMFDSAEVAEYLYNNGIRKINNPGYVIVRGEVYVVTPELEEKLFKLLNQ